MNIKLRYFLLLLLQAATNKNLFSAGSQNPWEDEVVFEKNKEKPHATFMLYASTHDAIKDDYSNSPYYKSLNGIWKFVYTDK
jgi:beta-galactosidase